MIRIRKLEFVRFGMFSDKSIDFGDQPENKAELHIIHGPNESGKTTVAEGCLRLLYGFPMREPYDYVHQRKNLQVRGEVELDGKCDSVIRLPSRKNSLTNYSGMPYPEDYFEKALSGFEEAEYRKLFCLNDETIEKGGDEITTGKGDIGKLLFGAAAGISEISEILDEIQEKSYQLYKPRARKAKLPNLKRDWEEIDKQIKSTTMSAAQFSSLGDELNLAQKDEEDARIQLKRHEETKSRYTSLKQVLRRMSVVESIESYLSEYPDYPSHIPISQADLDKMIRSRIELESEKNSLKSKLEKLESDLNTINQDPKRIGLLSYLKEIEQLRSRYETAEMDISKRKNELQKITDDMQRAAADVEISSETDLTSLAITKSDISTLFMHCNRLKELSQQASMEQKEVDKLKSSIDTVRYEYNKLKDTMLDGENVSQILESCDIQELRSEYTVAIEKNKEAADKFYRALKDLSVRNKQFDSVPSTGLNYLEANEKSKQLLGKQEEAKRLQNELLETENKQTKTRNQIMQLKNLAGLASDAEVENIKERRNKAWQVHRKALTTDTADSFEITMYELDDASDLRQSSASRLGELRQMETQSSDFEINKNKIKKQLLPIETEISKLENSLNHISESLGIEPPLEPIAVVNWLERVEIARTASNELSAISKKNEEILKSADLLKNQLVNEMNVSDESVDFIRILINATKIDEDSRKHRQNLASKQSSLDELVKDLNLRSKNIDNLHSQTVKAENDLNSFIKDRINISTNASDIDILLERFRELQSLDVKRSEAEYRVQSMQNDQSLFCNKVNEIAEKFQIPLLDNPLELYRRLEEVGSNAKNADKEFTEVRDKIEEAKKDIGINEHKLTDLNHQIKSLAKGLPDRLEINSLEDLRAAFLKINEIKSKRDQLEDIRNDICFTLDVGSLDEARSELAGKNNDTIESQLAETEREILAATERYEAASQRKIKAQVERQNVPSDENIAKLVEKRRTIELEMQEVALEHLEWSFGHRLAEGAIRRYSETHRSGMLKATESAFSKLTNGAYQKLRTQFESGGEILVAIDKNNFTKRADTMSKGTRFQLYLALRAAAYEHMVESGVVLPFFCDDVFETFDEDRTRAACLMMNHIGHKGQAIYFTHHQHVVDIAREVCGENLRLHPL